MLTSFRPAHISGNLLVLPHTICTFEDDAANFDFPIARSLKLKEVMGYGTRHVALPKQCVSDLVAHGFHYLRDQGLLDLDSLDGIILVTQMPDQIVPQTSAIVHGMLGLKQDMLLLDITQGCAGFVIAAMEALAWLQHPGFKRIAVVTADILSRKISSRDRNSLPLAGDAAAITIFDRMEVGGKDWPAIMRFDGSRALALQIPAGGARLPSTVETARMVNTGDNNWRAQDHLCMDGTAVFNFVMSEVPITLGKLFENSGQDIKNIDWFFIHQPNRFMVNKLADKLGIPRNKMPDKIAGKYGNSNSATIPAVIADTLPFFTDKAMSTCFAGFGVGLSTAALLGAVGPLNFNAVCVC